MRNPSYQRTAKKNEISENFAEGFVQGEEFKDPGWYKATVQSIKKKNRGAIVECWITSLDGKHEFGTINGFLSSFYYPNDFTDTFFKIFSKNQLAECKGKSFKAYVDYSADGVYVNVLGAAPLDK